MTDYNRTYYEANKEAIKAKARERYARNKEKILARNKDYVAAHRGKVLEARKRYWHGTRKAKERAAWQTAEGRALKLLRTCRSMARPRGIAFSLTVSDILPALIAGTCQVSGIEFDFHSSDGPWRPSIDRIDSSRGYSPDNVQIVAWMVNAAKQQYPMDDLIRLAHAIASRHPASGSTETQGAATTP